MARKRVHVHIDGTVQGVGFRPFVYRVAKDLQLAGWVCNSSKGVDAEFEGTSDAVERALAMLESEHPPHATVTRIAHETREVLGEDAFSIVESEASSGSTSVLPDLSTCDDCRREVFDSSDRRYRYPFTNCTNCGPRFSIIEAIPYDRAETTMRGFEMCVACQSEYEDPLDRRFHAQPNACPECGPKLMFRDAGGHVLAERDEALRRAEERIRQGDVVAIKGLGGFHLVVDATNESAVAVLRQRKQRGAKPFAVMFPSLDAVREVCRLNETEARLLAGAASPIVLVERRKDAYGGDLARSVAPRNPRVGAMLPYTPLHLLLLDDVGIPLVATSANRTSEPICTDGDEAVERLHRIADGFLDHDRPIARPVEDSVAQVVLDRPQLLRYARGFAPQSVASVDTSETVLAAGGHMKSAVALVRDGEVILGPHVGDLDTLEAVDAYDRLFYDLPQLHAVEAQVVAHDLHPDYHSTQVARAFEPEQDAMAPKTTRAVQHHHAHVAAVMAEHGLDGEVLGVAWDGTGYGGDGTIWGGEFLRATRGEFARVAHLHEFCLPGGEVAMREPRRSALGVLCEVFEDIPFDRIPTVADAFDRIERDTLVAMCHRGIRCVYTTSAGRLFDAVASLLGICHRMNFEAEAAVAVQFAAEQADGVVDLDISLDESVVDWRPLMRQLVDALESGESVDVLARSFHMALADAIVGVAERGELARVALGGGCFQNRLLLEESVTRLRQAGFEAYWPQKIPAGDGGLAAGQAVVATN